MTKSGVIISRNYELVEGNQAQKVHSIHSEVTGITSNGAGATINLTSYPLQNFAISVLRTAGSNVPDVDLEGSFDGTNWTEIISNVTSLAGEIEYIANKPVRYVRYNVVAVGVSNTLTINVIGME